MKRPIGILLCVILTGCNSANYQSAGCSINCDGDLGAITVDAGEDIRAFENDTVELAGSATYSGNATLQYQWSQIAGPSVAIDAAETPIASFVAPILAIRYESLSFLLAVTASDGSAGSDTVTVELEQAVAFAPSEVEFNDTLESAMALSFSTGVVPTVLTSSVSGTVGTQSGIQSITADQADVFVFSPPGSTVYELTLCSEEFACGSEELMPGIRLTLNDQDGEVLAWSGNAVTLPQSLTVQLYAGVAYYAVVHSLGDPEKRSVYTLSIVSHQAD